MEATKTGLELQEESSTRFVARMLRELGATLGCTHFDSRCLPLPTFPLADDDSSVDCAPKDSCVIIVEQI